MVSFFSIIGGLLQDQNALHWAAESWCKAPHLLCKVIPSVNSVMFLIHPQCIPLLFLKHSRLRSIRLLIFGPSLWSGSMTSAPRQLSCWKLLHLSFYHLKGKLSLSLKFLVISWLQFFLLFCVQYLFFFFLKVFLFVFCF